MKFGEKLKQLRRDNGLTQEDLADKLYVTRTAISKWETDKGFPAIDSLKLISELFHVSVDDLISDGDIETKKLIDERRSKLMYGIAIGFLALATAFSLLAFFLRQPYLNIGSTVAAVLYVVFGSLSKPRYKRLAAKKVILPYVVSRAIVLLFLIGLVISSLACA